MSTDLALLIELHQSGPQLETVDRRPRWHLDAACRGKPTEWFFPTKGAPTSLAKGICGACPVVDHCAAAGVGEAGIWAGETERKRRRAGSTAHDRHTPSSS